MSEELPHTKRPHPIRLVIFMLIGAGFGALFTPVPGGRGMESEGPDTTRMLCVLGASLAGGAVELLVRVVQRD
jgi:hypothetical protein